MNRLEFIDLISNDKKYNDMKKKLENLEAKIHNNELSSIKKISLCEKAMDLASTIYEYSKSKGYDSLYKEFFSSNLDEYKLNNIAELLEHNKIYTLYETAYSLEKENSHELALEKYFEILHNYVPIGSTYYKRPAILLEKLKRYEEAIKVCDLAIKYQQENNLHFPKEEFEHRKNRLLGKLTNSSKTNNERKKSRETTVTTTKQKVKENLDKLDTINAQNNSELKRLNNKIEPSSDIPDNSLPSSYDVSSNHTNKKNNLSSNVTYSNTKNKKSGCLTTIIITTLIILALKLIL